MRLKLEQLFLTPSGPGTELLLVLENPAGARTRERLLFPTRDVSDIVRRLAAHLARRGDVTDVSGVRVRRRVGGDLRDEPDLGRRLLAAFDRALDERRDD